MPATKITNKDKARKDLVKTLVSNSKGRIFTVTALRKSPKKMEDGTTEEFMTMTCRTGVKKHLKGGESTIKHKEDLISVCLTNGKGYRCFSAFNVLSLNIDGHFVEFDRNQVLAMRNKTF